MCRFHVTIYSTPSLLTTPETVSFDKSSVFVLLNPLKCSGARKLHFEVFSTISDIRALWCSGLNARVPKCQKLKT